MIKSARITELALHPDVMDESTLAELRDVVAEFPFFHAARILLLENEIFLEPSKRAGLFDSQRLCVPCYFELDAIIDDAALRRDAGIMSKDRTMSFLNDFLGESDAAAPLIFDTPVSADYLSAMDVTGGESANTDDACSETVGLIDSFLSAGADAFKLPMADVPANDTDDYAAQGEDCAGESETLNSGLNQGLFTETLASIYIKQHRYSDAIEIIRSLSLNFPNKSSYFADQIRYLEKLIDLSKQKRN